MSNLGQGLQKLSWPNFITKSEYANRCVTFIAMKNEPVSNPNAITEELRSIAGTGNENFVSEVSIVLPMPDEINDEQAHTWNQETGIIHDMAKGIETNLGKLDVGTVKGMTVSPSDKFLSSVANGALTGAFGNLDKMLARAAYVTGRRKPLLDPGYFQNYTGSEPRSFAMSWTMIPESQDEAASIRDIITAFKRYSLPSIGITGVSLWAPYFFNVTIGNDIINNLFHANVVVCTGIDVMYSSQVFTDGMPKQIQLTLRFKEARLNYADNYGSTYDRIGEQENTSYTQSTSTSKIVTADGNGDIIE